MRDDAADRRRAMKLVGQRMRTPAGRASLTVHGAEHSNVAVALDHEPIEDVMLRVMRHSPPVIIAILRNDELLCMETGPGQADGSGPGDVVGAGATIGMLYDAVNLNRPKSMAFQLDAWTTRTFEPVSVVGC